MNNGCDGRQETPPPRQPETAAAPQRVRAPAVAGLFYPKEEKALAKLLDAMLQTAPVDSITNVRALICPHAGYEYSGPVAAHAYKTLPGHSFDTVIILAASHYADFRGVSVPDTDAYELPLGRVPVSEKAKLLARQRPFVLEPQCYVQRPSWAGYASKPAPAIGEDTPETWEHSIEVQVPFLQRTIKDFKILPVMFGDADPAQVARALADIVDEKTLVVASTDLSHYHPYDEARRMDQVTVKWICGMDFDSFQSPGGRESACGRMAVLALMHLARLKGWTPQLLDYRNSGDTSGDKSRGVVGYAAIAFSGPASKGGQAAGLSASSAATAPSPKPAVSQMPVQFTGHERKTLLDLARKTLKSVTTGGGLPQPRSEAVSSRLKAARGCFVTLTEGGELRGCIGNLMAAAPLHEAVMENARSAALLDSRFRPVTSEEVDKIHIEISVLTEPQPLAFSSAEDLLDKLQPQQDGVVLRIGPRSATFLPQVWERLPDKVEFLSHLAQKAGCEPSAWRGEDTAVSIYRVEAFEEPN
jgi:AmmeMemoRadiSam system protein B/AmmeMemoRadiSam system protein A